MQTSSDSVSGNYIIQSVSLSLPNTINAVGFQYSISGYYIPSDTAIATIIALVNQPDGVQDSNDVAILEIVCVALPPTPDSTNVFLTTHFTHRYQNTHIVAEDGQSLSLLVLTPTLALEQHCAPNGDAQDRFVCTLKIWPTKGVVSFFT